MKHELPNIVLLCGGVGGTKLAEGFYHSRYQTNLKIIGNVADDQEFHGLWVSPDIDTLTYTLAGIIDKNQGWGLANDSKQTLTALNKLGVDTWMFLGDKDFATHIFRTEQRKKGISPSAIAKKIATQLSVKVPILLPTDNNIQTKIKTELGWLNFQDYFVKDQCRAKILDIKVVGIEQAIATTASLAAIEQADLIVIAPSNPVVSISPIINVPKIKQAIMNSSAQVIAVSPFFSGKTVKGPADKMMLAMGYENSNHGLVQFYHNVCRDLIDLLVIDRQDSDDVQQLDQQVEQVCVLDTLMSTLTDKINLAESLVSLVALNENENKNSYSNKQNQPKSAQQLS